MVNRVAASTGPSRWVRALADADLRDGGTIGVDVEGRKVLLHRTGGRLYAMDDVCSHAGALLSRGQVDGCVVTCPLHEIPLRPAGRAHRARAGPPSPAGAARAGPERMDRGARLPASAQDRQKQRRCAWRGKR